MSKNKIIIVSLFAAVLLMGMVALQLNWIKSAVLIKEKDFNNEIQHVFTSVMTKVNHYEQKCMQQRMMKLIKEQNAGGQNNIGRVFGMNSGVIRIESDILNSIFDNKKTAYHSIDTLIKNELSKNNIKLEYSFNVFDKYNNITLIDSLPENVDHTNTYVFPFLSNDIMHQLVLVVSFPNEKAFILRQISLMILLSLLLIIGMVYLFSYSISTIIKQEKVSEMKNDFINNMTHEFKTPISTISLACQALTDKDIPKTRDIYDTYIGIINEENHRLGNMAEKILQSAVVDKPGLNLKVDEVDLHKVIIESVKNIEIQAKQKQGGIRINLNATRSVILADAVHVGNVIYNLLDNAIKYTKKEPDIVISTVSHENCIEIIVADNGIGISKANQKKIFEKLFRVSTGNIHEVKGFGLGLSYVKAIVDRHRGSITLDSQLGKGTSFFVKLPFDMNTNQCYY